MQVPPESPEDAILPTLLRVNLPEETKLLFGKAIHLCLVEREFPPASITEILETRIFRVVEYNIALQRRMSHSGFAMKIPIFFQFSALVDKLTIWILAQQLHSGMDIGLLEARFRWQDLGGERSVLYILRFFFTFFHQYSGLSSKHDLVDQKIRSCMGSVFEEISQSQTTALEITELFELLALLVDISMPVTQPIYFLKLRKCKTPTDLAHESRYLQTEKTLFRDWLRTMPEKFMF